MSGLMVNVLSLLACGLTGAVGCLIGIRCARMSDGGPRRLALRLGGSAVGWFMVLAILDLLWYDPFPLAGYGFAGQSGQGFVLTVLPTISGALFGVRGAVGKVHRSLATVMVTLACLLIVPTFLLLILCLFFELAGGLGAPSMVA